MIRGNSLTIFPVPFRIKVYAGNQFRSRGLVNFEESP